MLDFAAWVSVSRQILPGARTPSEAKEKTVGIAKSALASLGRVGIIIGVAFAFFFGLAGTVYLSLRTSEVKVPDIVGKDRMTGETTLTDAGLNIRVRATRPANDAKPDTILAQLPHAGEVVKVGQTVAVDVSRAAKEGESTVSASAVMEENKKEEQDAANRNTNDSEKNLNDNANKEKRKKPVNKNANNNNANGENANNANTNNSSNANNLYGNRPPNARNANGLNTNARNTNAIQNANTNRATNANIRNTNTGINTNRAPTNLNTNRRPPNVSTPPFTNPNTNRRTTP